MSGDPVLSGEWNRERIQHQLIAPWKKLEAMGVGVHVGEWGAHHFTPHDVTLAWMRDMISAWKEAGWGWALWNFRGTFGILDSERTDVTYEDFHGHKLDRKMLEILRAG
jgi:endoglucanase